MEEKDFDDFEMIGEGGFSAVFKATYTSPEGSSQVVAVKKITVEKPRPKLSLFRAFSRTTRVVSSFGGTSKPLMMSDVESEIDILETMTKHKFVLDFLDAFMSGVDEYWIITECAMGDLDSLIRHSKNLPRNQKKQRYLPIKLALHFLSPIVQALSFLHENQIIHRDVKEDNIVISSKGVPKLTDFGAAKRFETLPVRFSKNGAAGTFYYMAPEVLRLDPFSTACDAWGLGITFLSVVYGGKPFELVANFNLQKLHEFLTKKAPKQNEAHANNTRRVSAQKRFYRLASLNAKPIDELIDEDFDQFSRFVKHLLILEDEGRLPLSEACEDPWIAPVLENWDAFDVERPEDVKVNDESKDFLDHYQQSLTLF